MSILAPIDDEHYAAFVSRSIAGYAVEKVASGQWAEDQSLELSRQALAELLPQGRETADNYLFSVLDGQASAVGTLWIGVKDYAGKRAAYIYDLWISPEHRRRGHATRALTAAEAEARKLGLSGIGLHVFGHNAEAQSLYQALGYRVTNINMFKSL